MVKIAIERLHIATHSYAAKFSIKTFLCETNNIFYSQDRQKRDQTNQWFWKCIENKVKITCDIF